MRTKIAGTCGVVVGVLLVLGTTSEGRAAVANSDEDERVVIAPTEPHVPLAFTHTDAKCLRQSELRGVAQEKCDTVNGLLTNIKFANLCGALGAEAMYSTIFFDCYPKRTER
jgi:hypothetical protein